MDDVRIVQLYFERNEQAISETASKYGGYCTSIARNILTSREDAEECVNDTYLNAWNSIPPHKPCVLSAFLGKIVRNLAFNRYKYNTADKRGGGEIALVLDELSELVSGDDEMAREYDQKRFNEAINAFLGGLPDVKRKIFVCRYWYSDSVSSIARRFGMTDAAVAMMLSRIRSKLHSYLIEGGIEI